MHYYGAVYRPPSEAYSLIVQCTLGCSHNKCAFCNMYKDKKFSIRPVEEVLRDLAEARSYERRIERIFLADGDALILPMDYLLQVLDFIREYFTECTRGAAYAASGKDHTENQSRRPVKPCAKNDRHRRSGDQTGRDALRDGREIEHPE